MRLGATAWGLGLALACCSKPSAPPGAGSGRASASAAPSATPPRDPVVVEEVAVPGLRVRTGTVARAGLWGFSDLMVDLAHVKLEVVQAAHGASLPKLAPPGALALVNGGYFEADFRPSTWLKSGGQELSPKADASRGGVFAVGQAGIFIGPLGELVFEPHVAVQSFPLIVEPRGKPGISRDDGRRAARTVVCLVNDDLHFIVISAPRGGGPSLFESMSLLREPPPHGFGCNVALNLDGGPSSGVWFGPSVAAKPRLPTAPVAYGIAVLPRQR